jgi:hypothetical protein
MACYDIAKPLAREAVLCSRLLVQYKDYIPEDNREASVKLASFMFANYFIHCFNRQYLGLYGSQKLEIAQRALFPIIAYEFNKQFSDYQASSDIFFDGYMVFDQGSVLPEFSNSLSKILLPDLYPNPQFIATIAKAAENGLGQIAFQPKLIELSRWY